jgi:uncharacterized protein (UPF0332 family)
MKLSLGDLIKYRIERAYDTLDDARILAENGKWNSCVNRLYYACFIVSTLLVKNNIRTHTHNGAKSKFHSTFVKTGLIDKGYGKLYSDLFDWRQQGDYADFVEFDEPTVVPLIEQTQGFIKVIENLLKN